MSTERRDPVRMVRVLRHPSEDDAAEAADSARSGVTLRELLAALDLVEKPDEQFADDLEEIQAGQPSAGESPWPS